MRIPDIFRLNDWQIRRSSQLLLSLLVAFDVIFFGDKFIFELPILPQLMGFVVLTFIPGFIILKILRIHDLDRTTNFLLAAGISLSFIMIFGVVVNNLLPPVGISNPISSFSLFYSFNIAIVTLVGIAYLRDKDFSSSQDILDLHFSPLLLSLLLLPFLSILGAYIMSFYNSNLLILLLLFLLSLVPIIVAFDNIPEKLYPLVIFVVSLSILYHINLISTHLWSYDIFFEAYSAQLVVEKGTWEPNVKYASPLLLISILAPTYSLICNLNLVWVFKIIFPFLFALTPLALYQIYQRLDLGDYTFDSKSSLLAVLIFVFYYGFFKDMPDKQHIAEFFLALILLLMIIKIPSRIYMVIIFSFALIVSHYGVSYIFLFSLIFALLASFVWRNEEKSTFKLNFVLLFSVLAISWYIYVASGMVFESITHIGNHVLSSISEILQPDPRSGVTYVLYETPSTLWLVYKVIHIAVQVLIAIGMMTLLSSLLNIKIKNIEVPSIIIAFYSLLVFQITMALGMGFDRVLQITLTLLSPVAVVGCISTFKLLNRGTKRDQTDFAIPKKAFAVFLMIFLLFNSGFAFEASNDTLPPYCIALNKSAGWPVYDQSEVNGISWLKAHGTERDVAVYNIWHVIKSRDGLLAAEFYHATELIRAGYNTRELTNSYVFLGKITMEKVEVEGEYVRLEDIPFYSTVLTKSNIIYTSGNSTIYITRCSV